MKTADKKGTMADSVTRSTMLFSYIFKVYFLRKNVTMPPLFNHRHLFAQKKSAVAITGTFLLRRRVLWSSTV